MSRDQDRWDAGERDYKAERDTPLMSPNERAGEIASLAKEVAAAMATFPRLNATAQMSLMRGCNITLARLECVFVELLAQLRKDANS